MQRRQKIAALALGLLLAALLVAAIAPLPSRLSLPHSPVVRYRDGSVAHVFLAPDDRWRISIPPTQVDSDYLDALIAFEDARFYWHPGVDPLAILRATGQNLAAGGVVSGASTLSMQLVRLAEPRPRTLASKAIEALRALQVEIHLSKDEVLSAYLALAPFGRNLEGVEAASWAYFGHGAEALTAAEICTLLAVPQNPTARHPTPANRERLKAARDDIAARLLDAGALPVPEGQSKEQVLAQVLSTPVPVQIHPMPQDLPHGARWMRGKAHQQDITTTLDRGTQALAWRAVRASREESENHGIHNIAVVVVDWQEAEIRALVGSFDFWDPAHGGQIAAFDVPRSPGSTLKPFVYAEAVERGLSLPGFLVPDVPVSYGSYAPENYDGDWDGLVRMEEALSRSLNVPFVELLGDIGVEPFLGRMRSLGVRSLDPRPGHYGLSLVVGGIELTPLELAGMYSALADGGRYRAPRWEASAPADPGRQVIAPGAAFLTRRALALRDRPDFPSRRDLSRMPAEIHWKTGTSFGHRDAWAVGSGRRHTVVTWLGNLDNTSSRHLVGAEAAGPLLFDLLEGLSDGRVEPPESPPEDLKAIEVCALSGHLLGESCPHRKMALALEAHVPPQRCPYHRQVEVDVKTGLQVGPGCRDGGETRLETVVQWPASVRRWLAEGHRRLPEPPALAPGCESRTIGPPRIVSPEPGSVALLIPGVPSAEQEIPLEADSSQLSGQLSWFLDGVHIGSTKADERLWWAPVEGEHEILVMDEGGRTDRLRFRVRGG